MADPVYDEEKKPVSPETEDLKQQEQAAHEDQAGRGYTGDKGLEKISTIKPSVSGVVKFAQRKFKSFSGRTIPRTEVTVE